ncbi:MULTISPECIES: restriction endonuclease subunit S [Marinobacter]|uniref:restriction endonuclease subunit S n=1 Tax=Marinobacter TaxID=2742 RepID=UPI00124892B4|nr:MULTISPECIES: restriction endonuclease subunit S [Marinobacter]MBL3554763.1 restriction endonuclease subunit S [Marinobacter sp. JB05H06]
MSGAKLKLGDVFDVARGGSPRPIESFITDDPSGVNWIMIGDAVSGSKYIERTAKKIRPEGTRKSRQVYPGDFLLTNSMSFGRPYILKTEGCIHDGWLVLSPKTDKIHTDFFYYYLGSPKIKNQLASRAAGAVVKNLNSSIVRELEIELPTLIEQKRIATILDKADALRRKRQQALELADQFLRSVFMEMFGDPVSNPKGWGEAPLSTGIARIESGWSAKGDNRPAGEGQIGVLKISSVTTGKFIPSENKVVDELTVPAGKKLLKPRAGDLLFSRANTRDLVAATAIVDRDYDNLFLPDKLWKIQTNEQLLPEFLNYLLWHQRMRDRLRSQATGTSGSMLNISKKKFEETSAIFPPIEKQRKFVDMYRKARAISEKYSSSSDLTEELFASASQKAFSSQL